MSIPDPELEQRIVAADRALAERNPARARDILEGAAAANPQVPDFWQRLATVRQMTGAPAKAIEAIDRTLSLAPLNFMNLLMRARLLDQAGHAEAGEAYGRALAQPRPDPLPAILAQAIARAETLWAAHQHGTEGRINAAVEASGADLTPAERRRAARLASNIARRTRAYHSEATHFHYPGLREAEFHDRELFPWLDALEELTPQIRTELDTLANATDAQLVPYVKYADSEPLAQWRELNHSRDWTAIHLVERGALPGDDGIPARYGAAVGRRLRCQCDVFAARPAHHDPGPCRRRQFPSALPPAANRTGQMLVPGRGRDT